MMHILSSITLVEPFDVYFEIFSLYCSIHVYVFFSADPLRFVLTSLTWGCCSCEASNGISKLGLSLCHLWFQLVGHFMIKICKRLLFFAVAFDYCISIV
jgi:hypothetical protein